MRKKSVEHKPRWSESEHLTGTLTLAALCAATLLFVVGVFDGTFLKPIALYLFCLMIVAVIIRQSVGQKKLEITYTSIHLLFILYILFSVVSLLKAENYSLGIESILLQCCLFIIFSTSVSSLKRTTALQCIIFLTTAARAIALTYYVIPESSSLFGILRQLSKISTLGNQTYFAGFLVAVLPIVMSRIVIEKKSVWLRGILVLLAIIIIYLLAISESRSAWLALLISMVAFAVLNFRSPKTRWMSIGFITGSTLLLFVFFHDMVLHRLSGLFELNAQSSVARRLYFYEGAWKAFLNSPVIGQGIGNFIVFLPKFRSPEYWIVRSEDIVPHAHNEFLEILSETGALGFLCFVLLLCVYGYIMAGVLKKQNGAERTYIVGFICAVIAVIIDNLSSMNLRTIPVAILWWIVIGLSLQHTKTKSKTISFGFSPVISRMLSWGPFVIIVALIIVYTPKIYDTYMSEKYYLEGLLLRSQNNPQEAVKRLREVISKRPEHAEARLYFAAQLIEENNFKEAQNNLNAILSRYPYYPKTRTLEAICALELGDTAQTFALLDAELSLERSPQTLYYASYLSHRAHRGNEELRFLKNLFSQNIRSGVKDYVGQGLALFGEVCSSSDNDCKTLLEQLQKQFFQDAEIVAAVGRVYRKIGMLTEAESSFRQALVLTPTDSVVAQELNEIQKEITTSQH